MAESLDFARQDGATKRRNEEWKAAAGDPELLAEYLAASAFKPADQAWWDEKFNVDSENFFTICESEVASHGLVYARWKNWNISNWHGYQAKIGLTLNCGKDLAELAMNYATSRKKHAKFEKTGHSKETEKHLRKWREVNTALKEAERLVVSAGVGFKKECVRRSQAMEELRVGMIGPWKEYFEIEAQPMEAEATVDEMVAVEDDILNQATMPNVAKAHYLARWQDRRAHRLTAAAKQLATQNLLPTPPPIFAYKLTAAERSNLLSPEPVVYSQLLAVVPAMPDLKHYGMTPPAGVASTSATRPPGKRSRVGTPSQEQKDPPSVLSLGRVALV